MKDGMNTNRSDDCYKKKEGMVKKNNISRR
jgi:hypothetical protein